jgi:hypothetical protein
MASKYLQDINSLIFDEPSMMQNVIDYPISLNKKQNDKVRRIFILVFSLVMSLLTACQSVIPVTITQATTTQPSVTSTFTSSWATNQTMTYLYSLATSPAALRYLSDLLSQGDSK